MILPAMGRQRRTLTYNGRTQTLAQWAAEIGITADTLRHRLDERGMPVWLALTTPPRTVRRPRTGCHECRYSRPLSPQRAELYCAYLEITGHKRPCSAAGCRLWKDNPGRPGGRKSRR